ncbi:hypothetical protein [Sphaerisporangium siamense]|uniref:Uncharacterized protein n=1 Tax=Sphaerisporangium siamense TaxID=795645 RepID=A0A7W7DCR4_9ACTN|nr:hypothetical protein [Sphaerisporangium siamense]MBB4704134.1 hypothetical protein [Sphaerisporangium siamense]
MPGFPAIGVIEVKSPHVLECDTPSGGALELGQGIGHGPRLALAPAYPPGERTTARAAWRTYLGRLAERLRERLG